MQRTILYQKLDENFDFHNRRVVVSYLTVAPTIFDSQLSFFSFFFFKRFPFIYLFIYFMAVLGLRFCARAFSSCGKWGPLFIAVRGSLTIAASLVAEHRLQTRRLSSCGSRAQLLRGMWDLPRPGLKTVSPALAGRFSTTAPPGKPSVVFHLQNLDNIHFTSHNDCKESMRWYQSAVLHSISKECGDLQSLDLFSQLRDMCASLNLRLGIIFKFSVSLKKSYSTYFSWTQHNSIGSRILL